MDTELASYAVTEQTSRGRKYPEPSHPYRSDFERDRDRVIHSQAFRRLEGKTQVFTPGLDDSYRNRLTHTLEVSQIGRTIAKVLNLNENLTEAVCLAHDLGHPPFGHCGEDVLNELLESEGGFEHNRQVMRIINLLEHPYPEFPGLNLMYETRLGLAKHHSPYDRPEDTEFPEKCSSLEGQIADTADRIAYNCHDLEDGMRARLIDSESLKDIALFRKAYDKIEAGQIKDSSTRRIRTAKAIIDILVSNCIETSRENIKDSGVRTVEDVYNCGNNLIGLSEDKLSELNRLEDFLFNYFYRHPRIAEPARKSRRQIEEIFEYYCKNPAKLPARFRDNTAPEGLERTVCDYIAGMTDRYCLKIFSQIKGE